MGRPTPEDRRWAEARAAARGPFAFAVPDEVAGGRLDDATIERLRQVAPGHRPESEAEAAVLLGELAGAELARGARARALETLGRWLRALHATERDVGAVAAPGAALRLRLAEALPATPETLRAVRLQRVLMAKLAGDFDGAVLDRLAADGERLGPLGPLVDLLEAERAYAAGDAASGRLRLRRAEAGLDRGDGPWVAEAAMRLAIWKGQQGDWEGLGTLAERAAECVRDPADHDAVLLRSTALHHVGCALFALGRDPTEPFRAALALHDAHLGPRHGHRAYVLTDLARYLVLERRYAEALPLLERAAGLIEASFADHPLPPPLQEAVDLHRRFVRYARIPDAEPGGRS